MWVNNAATRNVRCTCRWNSIRARMPKWTGAKATVILAGEQVTVQLFFMRLCYSRRVFVMAFPAQKQEAFFEGHVQAFHLFSGHPGSGSPTTI